MKILLIEDDATIRRAVTRLLRRMFDGALIQAAESADEAIDLIKEATLDRPFDLVISDFNLLGGPTGGDVLEWIREHATYLEPRFVFLTDNETAKAMHKNYVEKPCEAATLRTAIETALNEARA